MQRRCRNGWGQRRATWRDEFRHAHRDEESNPVRFVMQTIEYEAKRQVESWRPAARFDQKTRLFNPDTGTTRTMRSKEDAHDYRYIS